MAPGGVQGFEAFAGSKVNSFIVCGSLTADNNKWNSYASEADGETCDTPRSENEEMEKLEVKMEQYVKIYSYGRKGTPNGLKR